MKNRDIFSIAKIGLIAGMAQVLAGVIMYQSGVYFKSWSLIISAVLLILFVSLAILRFRNRSGLESYWSLQLAGSSIGIITGIIYSVYNIISVSFIYADFIQEAINYQLETRGAGLSNVETSDLKNSLNSSVNAWSIALNNLLFFTILGIIVSMIATPIIKKRKS